MPQKILALEITATDMKAAVLEASLRDYRVAACCREPRSADAGSPEEQLRRFIEKNELSGDTVLSALPGDKVVWRTFLLPFRDRKRIEQTVPFELENQVPFDLDDVVVDYQVLHRGSEGSRVLAAMVPKPELERHMAMLAGAGLDPKVVDLGPLAGLNTLSLVAKRPGDFVFIDFAPRLVTVALYKNGQLGGLRTLTREVQPGENGAGASAGPDTRPPAQMDPLLRDLRWTILSLDETPPSPKLPCYIAGDFAAYEAIAKPLSEMFDLSVERLDKLAVQQTTNGTHTENAAAYVASLGLALREVMPATLGLNFRRGAFAYRRSQTELRKRLRTTGALAAVLVACTVGDLYQGHRQIAGQLAGTNEQVRRVVVDSLPDLPRVRNPTRQLQEEIDQLQQQIDLLNSVVPISGSTSLDILRAVAAAIPASVRLDADDYAMDPHGIRLRGNTDNAESVDAIKQKLIATGYFSKVAVDYVRTAKKGSGVDFRMSMALAKDYRPREEKQ